MNNSNRNYKIKKYYKHKYANNKTDFVIAIIKIGKIPAFRSKARIFSIYLFSRISLWILRSAFSSLVQYHDLVFLFYNQ